MAYASSARRTWSAPRSASLYTATAAMPRSRHARITRSAISPRFAMRTLRNGGVRGRLAPLVGLTERPGRRVRVQVVPPTIRAVDPLGIGLEAAAQAPVERVLFRRVRVLEIRLAAREVDDEAGAAVLLVLPEDLRADVAERALLLAVGPFLTQREEFADLILPHLDACDRPVHLLPPPLALERDVPVLALWIRVALPRQRA